MSTVGDNLRKAIEAREEPAVVVAERAGISNGALSYYLRGERVPRADVVTSLAEALGVRPGWLLTGEGAMRASAFALYARGLHEIDGILEEWDRPEGEDARRAEELFTRRFARYQGHEFGELAGVVRTVFGSLLARVMYAARLANERAVDDPAWRGDVAGRLLQRAFQRAREREPATGFDKRPPSTRAWIVALADMMEKWEDGQVGDPEIIRCDGEAEHG